MMRYHWLMLFLLMLGAGCANQETKEEPDNPGEVMTTDSGLKYQDLRVGSGTEAKKGDTVFVHYTGWLASNKKVFDSSLGKDPLKFVLGGGRVIKGWDEGVAGMKAGGKRKLMIPAKLAYGATGAGADIPPNADLVFEVQLVKVAK